MTDEGRPSIPPEYSAPLDPRPSRVLIQERIDKLAAAKTAAPLDLDALEAKLKFLNSMPFNENWIEKGRALGAELCHAAPALFAAARERDALREALEVADKALEPFACACERECYDWPPDPKSVCPRHNARETHAKIRAALSRDSSEEKHGDGR